MPGILEFAEKKWESKVLAAIPKWTQKVKDPATFEAYVSGISAVTGLPAGEVAASIPARNFKEFQSMADHYEEKFRSKVQAAIRAKKWAKNYVNAFRRH